MGVCGDGLFYIFIYLPIYFLFTLLQRLYWFCNGMSDIVSQIEEGLLYERSAQVFDIRWKVKKEAFQVLCRRNFLGTHRSFEHPNYVLAHNVSLLAVQMDMAIFVEVPHNYDIFDCRKSPFIHLGQFRESLRIITMPISSLVRCADELGDPQMKVIWLHSTGRCGSTAMSQVFETVPNCTTVSEPMCCFTARNEASQCYNTKNFRQYLSSKEYRDMFRAICRMMAKPNEHNPDVLFIKNLTLSGVIDVPLLEEYFPDHINLFLYRDCLDTVQSYVRSLNSHFFLSLVLKLRKYAFLRYIIRSPKVLLKCLASPQTLISNQWLADSNAQLSMSSFGLLVIQWGCCCHHYSQLVTSGKSQVRAIRYEDIIQHRHETITMLFKFCDISSDHVEAAKKSLEKDSQEGTVLSMSALHKCKKAVVTEEVRAEANFYLNAFKLSSLGEPTYLPGVLSPAYENTATHRVPAIQNGGCTNGQISISIPA